MQETLNLKNPIDVPEVNAAMLNSSSDFLRSLASFNSDFGTDFSVQNSARWQQGTYNKFKELAIHLFNPDIKKQKSINRIFNTRTFAINGAKDRLHALDANLKDLRNGGIKFNDDNDSEGQIRLDALISNLQSAVTAHPDMIVDISRVPWHRRRGQHNGRIARPVRPKFNCLLELDGYENSMMKALQTIPETDNPMNLYLNIAIPIPDITIDITHVKANDKLLYQSFYGSLVVTQTISLFDAIYLNRRIGNNTKGRMSLESYFSGFTYAFPRYSAYQHPFLSRGSGFNNYGTGNTCFGDLTDSVLASIARGDLNTTKSLLTTWSKTYPKNNISPLNRLQYFVFGKPLNRKEAHKDDHWEYYSDLCRGQVNDYPHEISKERFIETFCSNCAVIIDCSTYKDWTYVPPEIPDEDWITLSCFAMDIMNKDIGIRNRYDDTEALVDNLATLYHKCSNIVSESSTGRICSRLMSYLRVENMGTGHFVTSEEFNLWVNTITSNKTLSVDEFIYGINMCESIHYSHQADEENIPTGIEDDSFYELDLSERLKLVSNIKSARIAMQRISRTPEHDLFTYLVSVF